MLLYHSVNCHWLHPNNPKQEKRQRPIWPIPEKAFHPVAIVIPKSLKFIGFLLHPLNLPFLFDGWGQFMI